MIKFFNFIMKYSTKSYYFVGRYVEGIKIDVQNWDTIT